MGIFIFHFVQIALLGHLSEAPLITFWLNYYQIMHVFISYMKVFPYKCHRKKKKQFAQNYSLTNGISGANKDHLTKFARKPCTQNTLHHYSFSLMPLCLHGSSQSSLKNSKLANYNRLFSMAVARGVSMLAEHIQE